MGLHVVLECLSRLDIVFIARLARVIQGSSDHLAGLLDNKIDKMNEDLSDDNLPINPKF